MKKEINRNEAKELIAETILSESNCNLSKLKVNFPYYDYSEEINEYIANGKLKGLTEQNFIKIKEEEFFEIEFDLIFRPIYKLYFIDSFHHVVNEYLEKKLQEFGIEIKVVGQIESTGQCPCCLYYSNDFGEDGNWDICPVCFWEDGGNAPNHMMLEDAQQNFEKYGAMDEGTLDFIDTEGKIKYKKGK